MFWLWILALVLAAGVVYLGAVFAGLAVAAGTTLGFIEHELAIVAVARRHEALAAAETDLCNAIHSRIHHWRFMTRDAQPRHIVADRPSNQVIFSLQRRIASAWRG